LASAFPLLHQVSEEGGEQRHKDLTRPVLFAVSRTASLPHETRRVRAVREQPRGSERIAGI